MDLLTVAAVLAVISVGPGFLLLSRWRCPPLEKLCASIALSLFLVYLAAFVGSGLGFLSATAAIVSLLGLIATAVAIPGLRKLWSHRSTRRAILGYLIVLVWVLLLQSLVRHYGAANWSGDWYEHYQRALFFTTHPKSLDFRFIGLYLLPARPPLMNLVVGMLMAQVGESFAAYQLAQTVLNTLVFLPCAALARQMNPRARGSVRVLLALFVLSPMVAQNGTYTWTRLFAGFYILLGLLFYLRALRGRTGGFTIAAFSNLAVGALVHYSAGPFIVVIAAHYLLGPWRKRARRGLELAAIVAVCSAILLTWFAWSLHNYGARDTFGSNTSVTESEKLTPFGNASKIAENMVRTVVPFPLLGSSYSDAARVGFAAAARDTAFLLYQSNVMLALGSLGWVAVLRLLAGRFVLRGAGQRIKVFWILFVVGVFAVGVGVHGSAGPYGLAHICLQPLVLIGLALIASRFGDLGGAWRLLVVAGCAIDAVLGIVLHFRLQHMAKAEGLGIIPAFDSRLKGSAGLVFLGDRLAAWGGLIQAAAALGLVAALVTLLLQARAERLQ